MLPPRELKNKPFSKAVRGYSTTEVDEHIEFIIEKYTELYRANDELERRLKMALAQLDDYKKDENSIRTALVNAQKASAKIISEAHDRAEMVARTTKENCDRTIAELKDEIKVEKDKLYRIQRMVTNFKNKIFLEYQSHIQNIEKVAPEIGEWNDSDEEYVRRTVDAVKENMAKEAENVSEEPEISADELYGFIAGNLDYEIPRIESFTSKNFDPASGGIDDVDPIDTLSSDNGFEFAKELPATEKENDRADIFSDSDAPFETVGDDISSDTIELERIPVITDKFGETGTGVKDTIMALNKKFVEENGDDGDMIIEDFSQIKDDADREFLNMLKNATDSAGKRESTAERAQVKKRSKPLSFTDEFNLVYGSNKNKK